MVTFADATKSTCPIPTRAPARHRAGGFVAITCTVPHPARPLYESSNRTQAQLVSPSRDPIGYADGRNSYRHVSNSPLANRDPFGTYTIGDAEFEYCSEGVCSDLSGTAKIDCYRDCLKNNMDDILPSGLKWKGNSDLGGTTSRNAPHEYV